MTIQYFCSVCGEEVVVEDVNEVASCPQHPSATVDSVVIEDTPSRALTADGKTVTTIEQEGEYVGEELGRVWLELPGGWAWWGCQSVERARQVVARAPAFTAAELDDAISESKI